MQISTPPSSRASAEIAPKPLRIYTVGTLSYNRAQLVLLFFWLMWNDFSITLIEQVTTLNSVLMKNLGATYTEIALLASIGGFIAPWINPWVSTWSDRHRGPHGRRRPFLFLATPFFAAFLMAIPYMPNFFHWLLRFPLAAHCLVHLPMKGEVLFIGASGLVSGLFNAVVLAIFSYLYWDVVPETVMGRFQSLSKNVSLLAGIFWSFYVYGQADHHPKTVYVGTASFCLLIYLISVWKIKEGDYPAAGVYKKGGAFAPVRAYFVECFSQPYYLWVFFANALYQLGNAGGQYQFFYQYQDLKLDLSVIGWANGWMSLATTGFGLLCGFGIGSLTDRLKPVRLMGPCYLILSTVPLLQYFVVHDKWTLLVTLCLRSILLFATGIVIGAFTIEIFPREKLGQFCSAQAAFYQFPINVIGVLIAMLFDRLQNNRLGFLWTAVFYFLSGLAYVRVYFNWKQRQGQVVRELHRTD